MGNTDVYMYGVIGVYFYIVGIYIYVMRVYLLLCYRQVEIKCYYGKPSLRLVPEQQLE